MADPPSAASSQIVSILHFPAPYAITELLNFYGRSWGKTLCSIPPAQAAGVALAFSRPPLRCADGPGCANLGGTGVSPVRLPPQARRLCHWSKSARAGAP